MVGGGEPACVDRPVLWLLPRTLFSKQHAAEASAESEEGELDAIQGFFQSAALSGSSDFIEEAKTISNSLEGPFKQYSEDGDAATIPKNKDQQQGRRPALRRKRAHFSFNPDVSGSLSNVDLKSSVDHIEDPDELFLAFEKTERAKKELMKQRGEVASDCSLNPQWAAAGKRRPGILGRKASYKHQLPEHPDGADALVPSQGESQTFSPSKTRNGANFNKMSQPMSQPGASPEIEMNGTDIFDTSDKEGFVAGKEKGVDNLLDTLLHCFEDVNEGEEIDFLQERLQIMATNVDMICFPPLDGVQIKDVTATESKVVTAKLDGSQKLHVSPTVACSPLAAISVLRRRMSQIDPLKDPFLMPSPETSTRENSLPDEGINKGATSSPLDAISLLRSHISQIYPLKDPISTPSSSEKSTPENLLPHEGSSMGALSLSVYTDHPNMGVSEVTNALGPDHPSKASRSRLDCEGNLQSTALEAGMTIPAKIALADMVDFCCEMDGIADHCAGQANAFDPTNVVGSTSFKTIAEDNARDDDGVHGALIAKQVDCVVGGLASGTLNCGNIGKSAGLSDSRGPRDRSLDNLINTASSEIDGIVDGQLNNVQEAPASGGKDQSGIIAAKDIPVGGWSGNSNILLEQDNEVNDVQEAPASGVEGVQIPMGGISGDSSALPEQNNEESQAVFTASANRPVEPEAPRKGRKKHMSARRQNKHTSARRHSLAGAGMAWKSGVKRSTRIKMKPLEYWRGERLLYARIHDTLSTVIGVKYSSPVRTGEKQALKVKSYVSEQYADLVQKVALY